MLEELYTVISVIIERRRDEKKINAGWVAKEAMQTVDPDTVSIPCVYAASFEHSKQYARGLLRKTFDPVEEDSPQHELFTELQWRYPMRRPRGAEPAYVLREAMIEDDVDYNVERFLASSEALERHARALLAWWARHKKTLPAA